MVPFRYKRIHLQNDQSSTPKRLSKAHDKELGTLRVWSAINETIAGIGVATKKAGGGSMELSSRNGYRITLSAHPNSGKTPGTQ